jgi:uncharacterized membrane protein YjfL (UPF0719 family)
MLLDAIADYARNVPDAAVPVIVALAFAAALWHLLNLLTPFDDSKELFAKNNYAYAIQRIALVAAQIIGMHHVISYSIEDGFWSALGWMCAEAAWVLAALLAARLIVDYVVLRRVRNQERLLAGDLAIGIAEAGFYLGFGFILNGSLDGTAPSTATGLASTVVFGTLGLVVVVGFYFLHELITPYSLIDGIERGHLPAAIETAGTLTALGIVVSAGVAGDFTTWTDALTSFTATVLFTVTALYLARILIDRIVLLGCTVKDIQENNQTVAALVLAALLVITAFPVEAALRSHL